jgi:hypothetical protein
MTRVSDIANNFVESLNRYNVESCSAALSF